MRRPISLALLAAAVAALAGWRLVVGAIDPLWGYMGTDTNAFALGLGALLASEWFNA